LRYFVAVGEEQHYGRAAERLGIAQPALSRQIQGLEKELGFMLFERLPRGVKLSAAGKLFLSDARRILQEVQEAKLRAERVATGKAGTLRVGFVEWLSWHGVVPDSFRRFRRRQPDAELDLQPLRSMEQIECAPHETLVTFVSLTCSGIRLLRYKRLPCSTRARGTA
jgi:DNA-binding transcriptional LysR family regulator